MKDPTIVEIFQLVNHFFKDDYKKASLWIITENPLLGNISPREMILTGRREKLLKFIKQQLDEGQRDGILMDKET